MNAIGFPSTGSVSDETRLSIARLQLKLVEAQKELASGRHADVGLALGADTGKAISFRREMNLTQSLLDTNAFVAPRMKAAQIGLQSISDNAQAFLSILVSAKSSSDIPVTAVKEAQAGLKAFIESVNTSIDGQFVFSGVNSDIKPLDDFFAASAPASKQGVDAAFLGKFGVSQQDPAAGSISAANMQSFLDNEFAAEFDASNWSAAWSAASDKSVTIRISRSETAETAVSANDQAFRNIASAFVLIADSGLERLNDKARQAVLDRAISQLGNGIARVGTLQSAIGVTQERVAASNDILNVQKNLMSSSLDNLEGVDPAEVSTRISALMTQLETAYTMTSRLNKLSLLDYL